MIRLNKKVSEDERVLQGNRHCFSFGVFYLLNLQCLFFICSLFVTIVPVYILVLLPTACGGVYRVLIELERVLIEGLKNPLTPR